MWDLCDIGKFAIPFLEKVYDTTSSSEVSFRAGFVLRHHGWYPQRLLRKLVPEYIDDLVNQRNVRPSIRRKREDFLISQGPLILGMLGKKLSSDICEIRREAVRLIGRIGRDHGSERALGLLIKALDDSDSYVLSIAVDWLRSISGEDWKIYRKNKWKEWWRERTAEKLGGGEEPEEPKAGEKKGKD
jgi:hypothetical protein